MNSASARGIEGLCKSLSPLPLTWNDCTKPACNWTGIVCVAGDVTQLYLNDRDMVGTLPPSIGLLTKLIVLYLQNNKISGTIPAEINQMTDLSHVFLNNNFLEGPVPNINNLKQLIQFSVYSNHLVGSMPSFAGNMKLQMILTMMNKFEGTIPETWADLPDLGTLCVPTRNVLLTCSDTFMETSSAVPFLLASSNFQSFFKCIVHSATIS